MSEQVKPASEQNPVGVESQESAMDEACSYANEQGVKTTVALRIIAKYLHHAPRPDYKTQRDAERYRWLREALSDRSMHGRSHHFCSISNGHPEELDEAIDSTIASVKGGS